MGDERVETVLVEVHVEHRAAAGAERQQRVAAVASVEEDGDGVRAAVPDCQVWLAVAGPVADLDRPPAIGRVDDQKARRAIGAVFAGEGTLLIARVWWATYFTIFMTLLAIPIEIVEISKRPHLFRGWLYLSINLAILVFLLLMLEVAFKLLTAKYFYRLINSISDVEIPLDTGDFRLMDRVLTRRGVEDERWHLVEGHDPALLALEVQLFQLPTKLERLEAESEDGWQKKCT